MKARKLSSKDRKLSWVRVRDITKGHVRVMVRVRERSLTINLFFIAVF